MASLVKKAVRGAAWTIGSSMTGRMIGMFGTIIITRFLAPSVVGEVAVAHLLMHSARRLSTLGFGQYVVATKDLKSNDISQISALHLVTGLVAFAILWFLAKPLSPWLKAPTMYLFMPGMLLSGFIDRLVFMPEKVLVRELRFKAISLTRASSEILYTAVTITGAAFLDWGGHAIVAGNLARSILTALVFLTVVKWSSWFPSFKFKKERLKDVYEFGWPLWVSTNAHFFSRSWDSLLFSKFFGAGAMGNYNLAYNLASIPSAQVGEHIGDVLLPSFAKMKAEQKMSALLRATGLLSLLIFPLAVGLGAVSETVVATVLSPEWQGVAPYLLILSVLSVVRPISWNINSYLQSQRKTKTLMILSLQKMALLLVCIVGLSRWGDLWACVGVGIAFGFHTLASIWVVHKHDNISLSSMFKMMSGPLLACVPMALAVFATRRLSIEPLWLRLILEIGVGAVVYLGAAFVFSNAIAKDFLHLLKKAFGNTGNDSK